MFNAFDVIFRFVALYKSVRFLSAVKFALVTAAILSGSLVVIDLSALTACDVVVPAFVNVSCKNVGEEVVAIS